MSTPQGTDEDIRSGTTLYAVLWPHKEAMVNRWVGVVHGSYPFETIGFLRTNSNRFANPVGYRTEEAAKALIEILFTDQPEEATLHKAVDEIIRVRAIQDFPPETAVGVVFALKDIVREVVSASGQGAACLRAMWALESRIDAVALMAFGAYARHRERLHLLKVEEHKRSHSQLMRLAMRKAGMEPEEAEPQKP